VSAGELEPALCGVSAPVLRPGDDRPLAVFSIWGYADRLPPSRLKALGAVVIEAAASVEVAWRDLARLSGTWRGLAPSALTGLRAGRTVSYSAVIAHNPSLPLVIQLPTKDRRS